jgi:hypothetical protein
MEDQSNSYIVTSSQVARHAGLVFDVTRISSHDHHVDEQIEQGHGDEGLVGLGGVIHQLAALGGEFEQADGRAHRGVLEDVEELGGERRHDQAEGHGQEHMAVGLRQGEAQGEAGVLLAAGQAVDARADLLADPGRGEEAQAHHGRHELLGERVEILLEAVAEAEGQHLRQHEVPDEELHQQRDVAEDLHVGRGDARQPFAGTVRSTPIRLPRARAMTQADRDSRMVVCRPDSIQPR